MLREAHHRRSAPVARVPARPAAPAVARRRRRAAFLLAAACLLAPAGVALAPAASAEDVAARPSDGVFVFDGRGFGHGRGMSQYGAHGAAVGGLTYDHILAFYYSGATLGTAPGASRRVLVTGEDADATVSNAPGLRARNEASGAVLDLGSRPDWTQVRARADGTVLRLEALQNGAWVAAWPPVSGPVVFEGPATISLQHPTGARRYRGVLRAALTGPSDRPLYVVNALGLDDYVRGVVPAEMPASWRAEALKAQAVAARSYGLSPCPQPSAYPATWLYDVVDTTACQVYRGADGETASTNAAVDATQAVVLRYGGSVLRSEFSASNGGWTVAAGGPYVAKPDDDDAAGTSAAGRPDITRWTGVRVPATALESAFGTGLLREIRVLQRDGNGEWRGRVLRVRLVGDLQTVEVAGDDLRRAAGLRSSWFSLAGLSPIDQKHLALGGDTGLLGPAVGPESDAVGGRYRSYQRGAIYWSAATGAAEVHGAVLDKYAQLHWEWGLLGFPATDELGTPDGVGRFNAFQRGSVYWTPRTGAAEVHGALRDAWGSLGWERGVLGYPVGDEGGLSDGGRLSPFERGSMLWSPASGAHELHGAIGQRWRQLGAERSVLRYPVTDETVTPDGAGRYNHFQSGSVYWSPTTGAHEVYGAIRQRWADSGWEAGRLGYPTTGEYSVPEGRRSDFQSGWITWNARTGATTVVLR
jgi:SpoIID/LytB domain protein